MSHNKIELESDWWLVLLSIPALTAWWVCIHAGLCILGLQIHGRSCTWTHNTGSFMLLRQCSAQLWQNRAAVHFPTFLWPAPWMHITPLIHPPQNIARLPLQAPYLPTYTRTLHPPHTQTESPPQPPSTCPLTTLRNHHPCQFQADPAILSATVRVSWSRVSCTAQLLLKIYQSQMRSL